MIRYIRIKDYESKSHAVRPGTFVRGECATTLCGIVAKPYHSSGGGSSVLEVECLNCRRALNADVDYERAGGLDIWH